MDPHHGASAAAIRHHYDAGNLFFAGFLGPSMTYSAALWTRQDMTLEDAQVAKLDWHLDWADAGPHGRLLDIGCGWGSLMRRAVVRRPGAEAHGLTLSREQAGWIEAQANPRVTAHLTGWQEFDLTQSFDAIISIGALEHFAQPGVGAGQKLATYKAFFRRCAQLLGSGARLSLQSIAWRSPARGREDELLPQDFFPESDLPYRDEILLAAAAEFELCEEQNRREDYVRTLLAWVRNIHDARDEIERRGQTQMARRYRRHFLAFAKGFETGILDLLRLRFQRR